METSLLQGALPYDLTELLVVEMAERGHLKKTGITLDEPFDHSFTVKNGKVTEWRMYDSHDQALEDLGLKN